MSSENKNVLHPIEKCSLVLVDVAGTTTSNNFVKETLFPFVTKHAETFLKAKWDEEPIKECLKKIGENLDLTAAIEKVKTLTEEQSSNEGLKTLQGLIYKDGYEKGDLKAHIFDDVVEAFESWNKNHKIAVYSTGSIDSQKLLFKHTIHGDISEKIYKFFDQTVGNKTEADSYKTIAKEVELTPQEIVFITDDCKEAKAAKDGGLIAVIIKREGNAELPEEETKDFMVISSFKELILDKAAKRKIEEEAATQEAPPSKVPKTDETKQEKKSESMDVDPPKSEETEKVPETETVNNKTEEAEVKEQKEEKLEVIVEEKGEEETAATEEIPKQEEATKEESKKEDEKPLENGEEKAESSKTEEKENKSVLANGVENGKDESEDKEQKEEPADVKTDEKVEEPEVVVKKIEESAESKTVSVEV